MFEKNKPCSRIATRRTSVSQLFWTRAAANAYKSKRRCSLGGVNLRFDHVIVGGVKYVASDDPHDAQVNYSLVGSPGQPGLGVLLSAPKRGIGRNRDGAVRT